MLPRVELPPSRWVLALIVLPFVLLGLTGHDPWKTSDAVAIEIVSQMLRTGDWLVPQIAGEAWIEDPPLYHWTAMVLVTLLGWVVPTHGAVRLASAAFLLGALWMTYYAARRAAGPEDRRAAGATAALLVVASIGLVVHAHEAVSDLATLAALCAAFAFATRLADRPLGAGMGLGAALGGGFLATGPVAPAAMLCALLASALVCGEWRTRGTLKGLAVAALIAVLVAASWPLALAWRSPALAAEWWSATLQARGGFAANLRYYLVVSSWYAWPAWPLALWAIWTGRREWPKARYFLPVAALVTSLIGISIAGPAQDINATVVLPPLALLAAREAPRLRRGAANALDWFGVMTFTVFTALVWLGYVAMTTGLPPKLARNFAKLAPGFVAQFDWTALLTALALAVAWIYLAFCTSPSPTRGVTRWAAGVAVLWGTFAALWMPWADHQKSYRGVALQIQSRIPVGGRCIARLGVGSAQRAVLSYHAGIRTQPFDRTQPTRCPLLIVQGSARSEHEVPGPAWVKLAEVGRPGDKGERLRLYQWRP